MVQPRAASNDTSPFLAFLSRLRERLSPSRHNRESEEGRSAERYHRALLSGATGLTAKVVNVGVTFVTIPITWRYLGNERFGLWMAISAVLAMAGFADFGIGNGVLNAVSTAFGKDDIDGVRRAISSGFAVLGAIAAILLTIFCISYPFIEWADFFRVISPQGRAEAGPAMAVFVLCFVLNIPLDIVQRVQLGLQQGFRTNAWQILNAVLSLLGVLFAIHARLGLPWLVGALTGGPLLGVAMNAIQFFFFSRRDLMPSWNMISKEVISQISRLGGLFFVLQLVASISYSADNFIVARTLGAADVAMFSIPQRLFSIVAIPVTMLLVPFWPAYGEASSRGDTAWIRRTLVRSLLVVFASTSIASVLLLFASNKIILLWIGAQIRPPFLLMLGFAVWTVLNACNNTLGTFLNGSSIVRFQVITTGIFGVGCLVMKILLAHRYGTLGVPWASTLAFIALLLPAYLWYVPRLLRRIVAQDGASGLEQV